MSIHRNSDSAVHPPPTDYASGARRATGVILRILDFLFSALYVLLGVRLALDFMLARQYTGFYEFIRNLSDPFYAPFKNIVRRDTLDGAHPIVWSLVVAIVAYMLLHAGIRALIRTVMRRA